jgi:DNA-directed RNA polymerase omega subunit
MEVRMTLFGIEKLLDKVSNKYRLSVAAAKEARIMNESITIEDKSIYFKNTSMALEKALLGKLKITEGAKKKIK